MQYLLMIHSDEKAMQSASKDDIGAMMAAYGAYTNAMKEAGVYVGGEKLHPASTATTVRVQNGKTQVLNGPYAEVKEQLGGYYLIEAPDLDAAIGWAARCPAPRRARSRCGRSGRCERVRPTLRVLATREGRVQPATGAAFRRAGSPTCFLKRICNYHTQGTDIPVDILRLQQMA